MRRGADLLVDALAAAGVRHVFSLSGNQILSVYDALIGRDVALIHTRHEASAVHMADGWARVAETPGVALVTAGPGHLNAVSALYTALMSQSPVVLLSGHAPRAQLGRGAFQEIDQVAAARPVVKAAWVAERPERLGEDMARALAIAAAWPPGPVHVSLPGDVLEAGVETAASSPPQYMGGSERPPNPPPLGPPQQGRAAPRPGNSCSGSHSGAPPIPADARVRQILSLLAGAKRPLIVAGPAMGRGARWRDVARFGEITGVPAILLESPRGLNDPALRAAATRVPEADLVLLLGKPLDFSLRFGGAPPFGPGSRFVLIGDAAGARPGALVVSGDPTLVTRRLLDAAGQRSWPRTEWAGEVAAARSAWPPAWDELRQSSRRPMHPLAVCAAIQPMLDAGATLVADGGEFGQWCQAGLHARERLINGPAGSIGSAIPMALGARLARPDAPVVTVLGDGTFGFHALEFDTAVRHGIPVVAVVGNDARWNAEHQLQRQQYGPARAVGCELLPTRYDRVVEALGGHGEHVERAEDLAPAIDRALASRRPACVNVLIEGAAAPTFSRTAGAH